ncbi:uncharacterized protein LOC132203001 isoform X1 [Neocloeon triangulifer]|uniref:uncharacterized protein LOC132203001 isoform X1 n=1 Tax=Neocloeon triangulifer TaxID=2078957 RepID=UPI00286F842C|nr:uncharacterized protein LOC132203001 isoform X1 [Neocloeon triangulifer]
MASRPPASLQIISPLFTEEILLKIIRVAVKDETASIKAFSVSYATAPGEGYLGIVYRIIADAQTGGATTRVSFIVKGLPQNLARRKTWKIPSFFKNEVLFYSHVLPIMQDFEQRKRTPGWSKTFLPVPKCLWSYSDGDNDFIVMLDLGTEGFAISDRTQGFNIGHCEAALEMLAHFHGLGLAMKDQEPDTYQKMVKDMVEPYYRLDYEDWYKGFLRNLQEVAIDAVKKVYPDTKYVAKMESFANDGQYKQMSELVKPVGPFSVPNHGDAWGPNFLYQYDTADKSRPSNIRLLDFQLMRLGSPVLDLLFFLYSVTTAKERDDGGWERILKHYHDSFCFALTSLGADAKKVFPFEDFLKEVKKYGRYGLGMGIESVPLSMVESENVNDLDAIEGSEEVPLHNYWKVDFIQHHAGRQRVADLVKFTVDQGFI